MLDCFHFAPTLIAALALAASTFAQEKTEAVPLKKFTTAAVADSAPKPPATLPVEAKPAAA
ncbi:MAG: hypothetical protein ABIP20_09035, partial [Chthoniobacteraceae bacterium]